MTSLEEYLLTCPKKKFERLYLDSLDTDIEDFARYERVRCIRHLSVYNLITVEHKKYPLKNSGSCKNNKG